MGYEHLFTNQPIAKEITVGGQTATYYFRRLTAGEQIALNKGQKTTLESGKSTMEVDLSDLHARNCLFLSFVWVDENGKRAYELPKLKEIPAEYIAAIVTAANEALGDTTVPQ